MHLKLDVLGTYRTARLYTGSGCTVQHLPGQLVSIPHKASTRSGDNQEVMDASFPPEAI